jgi:threonine/homoserine/homoserine lactone efflux protein
MSGFGTDLALFAAAFAVAIASPGPFAAALVARGMAFGFPSAAGMAVGGLAGDLAFASIALFGLALIAVWADLLIAVLRYAGAAWLIWLGLRLLTARGAGFDIAASGRRGFGRGVLAGATLGLGNPKAALFYAAVFPGFFVIETLTASQVAAIYAVIVAILLCGHLLWASTAARAGRWLGSTKAVTAANRVSGGVLAGAGIAIAAS